MSHPTSHPIRSDDPTPRATIHGYPRQGRNRRLKKAVESYWRGRSTAGDLLARATRLRLDRLTTLRDAGLDELPVGDFSLYDHVLDTMIMIGAVPQRFGTREVSSTDASGLDGYFTLARGDAGHAPLEMTKWLDTNYHYLVPELGPAQQFTLDPSKIISELTQAHELGVGLRPVVVGPVTLLSLAKPSEDAPPGFDPLDLLDPLVDVYADLLGELADAGVDWVQLDEPILVTSLPTATLDRVGAVYARLAAATRRPKLLVAGYFGRLGEALGTLLAAGVDGLAVDLVAGTADLDQLVTADLSGRRIIAGVVDGRNVWRTDLTQALDRLEVLSATGATIDVGTSCSLLHVPLDLRDEAGLDPEVASWLAFADQKIDEVVLLRRGVVEGRAAIRAALDADAAVRQQRETSALTRVPAVRDRLATVGPEDLRRPSGYDQRRVAQQQRLNLPPLPTTTIGSFPQTAEIRTARADLVAGRLDPAGYDRLMRTEIEQVIARQERLGLDVFVHGEPERNDMVQYFAEHLDGFVATAHGWVQSYGSRYVRPPILAGDVHRPAPITTGWAGYAQQLTGRPVKGMLTGPVTILAWSFVRDDQPLGETAAQVALALRDEVGDLEGVGVAVVQVDEPALRETLPLRVEDRAAYLAWAVDAFRLATAGAADATQIHTHMCYAEFGAIMTAIDAIDADVISLEAARSNMQVVAELADDGYAREVGPGVWDIHSPRVPSVAEMVDLLEAAVSRLPADRIWVNPDCGLKTRGYAEVEPALANLVEAARTVRERSAPRG